MFMQILCDRKARYYYSENLAQKIFRAYQKTKIRGIQTEGDKSRLIADKKGVSFVGFHELNSPFIEKLRSILNRIAYKESEIL